MQVVENKLECGQIGSESRWFGCPFGDLIVVSRQRVLVVGVSRVFPACGEARLVWESTPVP
jgi:hypothetical protein